MLNFQPIVKERIPEYRSYYDYTDALGCEFNFVGGYIWSERYLLRAAVFDGTLISADVGLVKPQPEIYRLLCETFSLDPDECVFIDDAINNAEGAYLCGMHPIVFHNDVAELRQKLRKEGVPV